MQLLLSPLHWLQRRRSRHSPPCLLPLLGLLLLAMLRLAVLLLMLLLMLLALLRLLRCPLLLLPLRRQLLVVLSLRCQPGYLVHFQHRQLAVAHASVEGAGVAGEV